MKCYWINVTDQTITEAEYAGLNNLKLMVGGWIECAKAWPNGDVLYVDEEGLLKDPTGYFMLNPAGQPIGSNGVIVGREINDSADTADPAFTLAEVRPLIRFLTRDQVISWARANSSEPFMSVTGSDGVQTVLARTGEMFGVAPGKPSGE